MSFKINNIPIGKNHIPFTIAEMSGNHNQSLSKALEIVDAAANSGASAIKLQTYRADTITLDSNEPDFIINDEKSLWHGRKLYELYDEAHTPWDWHKPIFDRAKKNGIICFSSPFDFEAVDFLETLNTPVYKIASFEITHLPLIAMCAKTGKPLIISTGNASLNEIGNAVECAKDNGAKNIVILKCTSNYPADASDANLLTIKDMQERFGVNVGLSDHTLGIGAAVAAVAMGATVIEKHFTLSRSEGGVDSDFSLEPDEFKLLVEESSRASKAIGKIHYSGTHNEIVNKRFRQSLWIKSEVKAGEILTANNVKICRPSVPGGLPPSEYYNVIGKVAINDLAVATPLTKDLIC